jgi:hypothetical protein
LHHEDNGGLITMTELADRTDAQKAVVVDFLYWEDCPSHERALNLLNEVVQEEGIHADIRKQQIETDEDAERLQFPGSPTIRVAGTDIDETSDLPVGLTCRIYRLPNGKMSPLPQRDTIVAAFRRAQSGP